MSIHKMDTRPGRFGSGWAPGGYYRLCFQCKEEFYGDKRAWQCADCAYQEPPVTSVHVEMPKVQPVRQPDVAQETPERPALEMEIRAAVDEYYQSLCDRKHGGVAQDKAFTRIERALGMNWDDYKAKRTATSAKEDA